MSTHTFICAVAIQWSGSDACYSSYLVQLMVDDEAPITMRHSVGCGSHGNTYVKSNLIPGTRHTFRARIYNFLGWGEWSDESKLWTKPIRPATPLSPNVVTLNATTAMLELTVPFHNGKPIDALRLQVQLGDYTSHRELTNETYNLTTGHTLLLPVSRLSFNTTESYRLAAHSELGWGEYSRANIIGGQVALNPNPQPQSVTLSVTLNLPLPLRLTLILYPNPQPNPR